MTYKEDMKFQKNICLYETGKVAVSARVISSDVRSPRVYALFLSQNVINQVFYIFTTNKVI